MTTQALATTDEASLIENVVIKGDLSDLSVKDRVSYYGAVCRSLGLNPLTKPFEYLALPARDGTAGKKVTLYARKDCTDQLRKIYRISDRVIDRSIIDGLCIVTVELALPGGRRTEDIGVVSVGGLSDEQKANALMKAMTKAKRRGTLSLCGLGFFDASEVEDEDSWFADATRPERVTGPAQLDALYGPADTPSTRPMLESAAIPPREVAPEPRISDAQQRLLHAEAKKRLGWEHEQVHDLAVLRFRVGSLTELTVTQANALLSDLQSGAILPTDGPALPAPVETACPRCGAETLDGECGACGFSPTEADAAPTTGQTTLEGLPRAERPARARGA